MSEDNPQLRGKLISEYFTGDTNDCRVKVGDIEMRMIADAGTYRKFGADTGIGLDIAEFMVFPASDDDFGKILT